MGRVNFSGGGSAFGAGRSKAAPVIEALALQNKVAIMEPREVEENRPPNKGETCVVAHPALYKRAALLFDKIWLGPFHLFELPPDLPSEITFSDQRYESEITNFVVARMKGTKKYLPSQEWRVRFLREISQIYSNKGISTIPFYDSEISFSEDYLEGNRYAYEAIINCIPIPSEDHITWKQVMEFRNDEEARRKYRSLRAWINQSLSAKSVSEAENIIGSKLDDYEWAIKKHGLKTVSGALKNIIDSKSLASIAASGCIAGFIGGPVWGAIASGAIVISKSAISISDRMIDLEDVKRGKHSEVAILYDMKNTFTNN